jgi:cytochrome P450
VPPESTVLFSMGSANRDPAVFEDPDRFDLERTPKDLLTFGRGERSCPGMHLARQSLAIALDSLAARLPGLRLLGDPQDSAPRGAIVRGPARLPVAF